jgi:hypothetical protein
MEVRMAIKEVTEERYDEMLDMLPPALWVGKGFLVGEPFDHRKCNITGKMSATYTAFFHAKGRYFEGDPMTTAEFVNFDISELPL